MRAYTLSVLQRLAKSDKPISDPEIVEWANETLSAAGKSTSITGFKDPNIANSMPVIDLVDSIKPGSIKYDLVNQGASLSEEVIPCLFLAHVHCVSGHFPWSHVCPDWRGSTYMYSMVYMYIQSCTNRNTLSHWPKTYIQTLMVPVWYVHVHTCMCTLNRPCSPTVWLTCCSLIVICVSSGTAPECQVCHLHVQKDRCSCLCSAWRSRWSKTKDVPHCVCLSYDQSQNREEKLASHS